MAGRHRHLLNRDGRYFARIVVPAHLRAAVGKTELRTALGADHRDAVRGLHRAVADLQTIITAAEAKLAQATGQVVMLGRYPLESAQMAARHYAHLLDLDAWFRARAPGYAAVGYPDDNIVQLLRDGMAGKLTDAQLEGLVGNVVERFRASGNLTADKGAVEWRRIAQDLCIAEYEALSRSVERDDGKFSGTPEHPLLRDHVEPDVCEVVDLLGLWDDYVASRQKIGSMVTGGRRQRLAVTSLVGVVGHQDAARLEKKDLLRWRDECLGRVSASTISGVYIPTVRSLFSWAVENDRLKFNPASDIKQAKPKIIRLREIGFTDEEALRLLKATAAYMPLLRMNGAALEHAKTTAAKRLVPVLCAFTGARVGEITQLRHEDVRRDGDTVIIRITPDAGSVKTGQFRDVPLHPQVIESGFLRHVDATGSGPLFHMAAKPEQNRKHASKMANRLGDWLQEQGLVPEGVKPSHGWRHRFKTVGREIGCQRRRKSRPRRRSKTRPVVEVVRHGARASHIAGACHGALAL